MNKLTEETNWRGERELGSGALRKTTAKQDKEIIRWVLKNRGKVKVSVTKVKKQFTYLRKLSDTLVEERLDDLDVARHKLDAVGRADAARTVRTTAAAATTTAAAATPPFTLP